MYEIGPCITPCNGHARQARVHTEVGSGGEHDRRLHSPMTAATGYKHVEHCGTKEGKQRIGDGIADSDAGFGHDATQADAADADACNDAHDTGIEGELQDDAGCTGGRFSEGTHIVNRCGMQQESQREEYHDYSAKVQSGTAHAQMNHEIGHEHQRHEPREQSALLESLCRSLGLSGGVGGDMIIVLQQRGVDGDGTFLGVHQGVSDGDADDHKQHGHQIVPVEDGLCQWHRIGQRTIGSHRE